MSRNSKIRKLESAQDAQLAPLRHLASRIKNQQSLERALLATPSRIVRREIYALIRPMLKFKSSYPDHIALPHTILPPEPILKIDPTKRGG